MTSFFPEFCVIMNLYSWGQESYCHSTGKTSRKTRNPTIPPTNITGFLFKTGTKCALIVKIR